MIDMAPGSTTFKNICLVTDSYWPALGGVERWTHSIASNLSKNYRITVITHWPREPRSLFSLKFIFGKPFKAYADDAGNRVVPLKPSLPGRLFLALLLTWNFPAARRIFPRHLFDFLYVFYKFAYADSLAEMTAEADLVHCFSTGYLGLCATDVCKKRKIPFIHSPAVHFDKWGDSPMLLRSYAKADAVMCLSESFKTEFKRRMPDARLPIVVIPAPVFKSPAEKRPDIGITKPFILFLGRREKHKGLFLLLAAFGKLSSKAFLVVAGPGNRLAPDIPNVIDLGTVDEEVKNWLLRHCAVFCLPSIDESFGIVYLEAMMHAKPIVALDIAPINELVKNGETGILVPSGNENLLEKALDGLLGEAEKRRIMGENGYKRYCEFYEGKKVMDRIMNLYRKLNRDGSIPA